MKVISAQLRQDTARITWLYILSIVTVLPLYARAQMTSPQGAAMADRVPATAPIESESLTVAVNGRSFTLSPGQLGTMPQTTVHVHNGHTKADEQFQGVALADLFSGLGLPQEHGSHQTQLLHSYIRAQGTDNYFVLFSALEVDHVLHQGNVIVALTRNGQALGREGHLMLVSTEDAMPMRSVRNLSSLTFSTVN